MNFSGYCSYYISIGLFDFIDQSFVELQKQVYDMNIYKRQQNCIFNKSIYRFPVTLNLFPLDLPFILHTLDIILSQSDHTTSLLRAISFIYTHFEVLTSHSILLDLLCNQILLDLQIFERLLLHWGKNVRIFFLQCLFWRVGRVWKPASVQWTNNEFELSEQEEPSTCDSRFCKLEWCNASLASVSDDTEAHGQCSL